MIINHILERNIINGSNFKIKLGTNKLVKINGLKISTFKFIKNSISSNKFKIIPNQKITKTTINNDLIKLYKIYFKIILFMIFLAHSRIYIIVKSIIKLS